MSKLIHIWKWISFAILTFVIIEDMPFAIPTKVGSILASYFIHMRLNVNVSILLYKKQKNKKDFEASKFIERLGDCSYFFTSKDPITLSVICIK